MDNKTKVTVLKDAPLLVEGKVVVKNAEGEVIKEGEKLFLCRCGASANKPFCDGAHKSNGFKD